MALALAPGAELDLARVLSMALLHDAAEARTGDLPRPATRHLPAGAKQRMEEAVALELFSGFGPDALASWREYEAGESAEARFVRLCDRLQLGLCLLAYRRAGWRGLADFEVELRALECGEFAALEGLREELVRALDDCPA